jgi:putative transposase
MCTVLQIPRNTYYYEAKIRDHHDEELTTLVKATEISMVKERSRKSLKSLGGKSSGAVLGGL